MKAEHIKNIIIEREALVDILENIGCFYIKDRGEEIRCAIKEGGNNTSLRIKKDTLGYVYFGDDNFPPYGDIINLVMIFKGIKFVEAINFLCMFLNISSTYEDIKTPILFGGYYKKKTQYSSTIRPDLPIYPLSTLENYQSTCNRMFLNDGISLETQRKYKVGLDTYTQRISVPWFDEKGNLIGVMGRYNMEAAICKSENIAKWYPLIPFKKSYFLYGLYQNKEIIETTRTIFIGESEKFPQQLDSMGYQIGVSIGSHELSDYQIHLIKGLNIKNLVLAYDKDISVEVLEQQIQMIKNNNILFRNNINIGYIYDKDNLLEHKDSPTDKGLSVFEKLITQYIVWKK